MLKNALKQYFEGEKNLETPARILLAALVEFGKDSPNSVGTREISKRAKVNISAISYYFGSKAKLYEELLDQIIEFLRDMESGFRARYDALMKKASREGAKQLLKDYMFWSVCAADRGEGSDIFKHVESIMMREEFYGNKSFDKIYKSLVSPNDKFVSDMIEMASGGRISGFCPKTPFVFPDSCLSLSGKDACFEGKAAYVFRKI